MLGLKVITSIIIGLACVVGVFYLTVMFINWGCEPLPEESVRLFKILLWVFLGSWVVGVGIWIGIVVTKLMLTLFGE